MPEDRSSSPASDDLMSDLARETRERRELAERESVRPRPKFIHSVEQSEVLYTFLPAAIPLAQIDANVLNDSLRSLYKLQLAGPDFAPLLTKIPREQLAQMDETELLNRLIRDRRASLKWTDGSFPLRDDFVPIRLVEVNFESIDVSVSGVSQVADVIAKEVMELLWQLAGSKRKFADLEYLLQLVAFATATRLNLGYQPECLLNPALMQFLDGNLAKGKRYASEMGRIKFPREAEEGNTTAIAALDDLTIRVSRFNGTTGYAEDSEINFSVTTKSDYRTGRLLATTTLAYEKHVELLTELFGEITKSTES